MISLTFMRPLFCLLASDCVVCLYDICCGHVAPLCAGSLQVKFTFSVPYIKLYQKDGLTCAVPRVAMQRMTVSLRYVVAVLDAFLLAILGTTIRSGRMLRLASSVWSAAQPISRIWRLSLRIRMRWVDTLAGCLATMHLYLNNKRAEGFVCG